MDATKYSYNIFHDIAIEILEYLFIKKLLIELKQIKELRVD